MNESPEQRRRRMRWLTLGEILAVAALAIAALGLWNGWHDGRDKAVVAERRAVVPLTLRAEPQKDGKAVAFAAVEPGHAVQSISIAYPTAFGIAPLDGSSDLRLSASDFDGALLRDRDKRDAAKQPGGERQLPLLVGTRYVENGVVRDDRAIYALAYHIRSGGMFGGRSLRLGAIRLVARSGGATQPALDRRWVSQPL